MKQSKEEELSDFIRRVTKQSHSCQLGALRKDQAIHIMINGMEDEKLKSELLYIGDSNVTKLTSTSAKYESAGRTIEELKSKKRTEKVAGFNSRCRCKEEHLDETQGAAAVKGTGCHNCVNQNHFMRSCPTIFFHNCNRQGHMKRYCKESRLGSFHGGFGGQHATRGRGEL